jgi:hypothetical protein
MRIEPECNKRKLDGDCRCKKCEEVYEADIRLPFENLCALCTVHEMTFLLSKAITKIHELERRK